MSTVRVIVVGGGAAGVFGAIACAEAAPAADVTVLEKSARFLAKVQISGGGRCNVTHACFDARELVESYPRGARELLGAFRSFQPADTMEWFDSRGVTLKTESDGRVFPQSDSSETIVKCLLDEARRAGVTLRTAAGVDRVEVSPQGGYALTLAGGSVLPCDRLLLATGGCRTEAAGAVAVSLGHTLVPPVPSLFSFHVETQWVHELTGVSVEDVELRVPCAGLRARGALLLTHSGLSGPAILRLSAWGARMLHALDYRFSVQVDWLPGTDAQAIAERLRAQRQDHPARLLVNTPLPPLPSRLWIALVDAAGVGRETRWADLSRAAQHRLTEQLRHTELPVDGKSLNKDEFVTCGGVDLREVSFKTMESRRCPGLHLAGELLDIDGLTGGFNLQAAWTTGWLAGRAMARPISTG